jgi:hypothetical protein
MRKKRSFADGSANASYPTHFCQSSFATVGAKCATTGSSMPLRVEISSRDCLRRPIGLHREAKWQVKGQAQTARQRASIGRPRCMQRDTSLAPWPRARRMVELQLERNRRRRNRAQYRSYRGSLLTSVRKFSACLGQLMALAPAGATCDSNLLAFGAKAVCSK